MDSPLLSHQQHTCLPRSVCAYVTYVSLTNPEPLPVDSPLLSLPNCVIFPHIGSATVATREKMALMAAENIAAFAAGKPVPYQAKL